MTDNVKRIKQIAALSIVRLEDGRVGYLETNTGSKPWVVVNPGKLAIEVSPKTKVTLLATPHQTAQAQIVQHNATRGLLAACKLALNDCNLAITGRWEPSEDGFRATAAMLHQAITEFERIGK